MLEEINHNRRNRRRFLANTGITIAAARFGVTGSARAQSNKTGRSASDQGATDCARSNSITHYLEQMSHHYSGPDWGLTFFQVSKTGLTRVPG
jgi:hypothetical protein